MNSDEGNIAGDQGQKPLTSGAQIGSYRIECQLGEGGVGTVYRALDTKLNGPVALKVLSNDLADAAARRRFQREAQMASSLNHPLPDSRALKPELAIIARKAASKLFR